MGAADAAALVHDGDTVVVPTGVGEPPALLAALSARGPELSGVTVSQILPLRKFDYFNPATVDNIRHNAYFFGGPRGPAGQAGWIDYVPAYFSELPQLIDRGLTPVDVVFSMASPMDEHGFSVCRWRPTTPWQRSAVPVRCCSRSIPTCRAPSASAGSRLAGRRAGRIR